VPTVDLNADLGEGYGSWPGGEDAGLLGVVTTTHIACGFHAGDPAVMRATVVAAVAAGVVVGAHPSYPDLVGFGRRAMDVAPSRVADDVLYQIGALDGVARANGTRVRSVKAHGALYHRLARDEACALAVARAVAAYGTGLVLVAPAGSPTLVALRGSGVAVFTEAFCDRGYLSDGSLVGRGHDDALLTDPARAAAQGRHLVLDHEVAAVDGGVVHLEADTLCVHGDTPGALAIASAVRRSLEEAGVSVAACAADEPTPRPVA